MKTRLNVIGIGAVRNSLRMWGEKIPDAARKQMHRSADRIVKKAKAYAPEDTGQLAGSIRIIKDYELGRGRLMIDIIVGGMDAERKDGGSVPIDQYAAIIHEFYEQYEPGPKTRAKMAANPGKVGSGFLTRAAEEEEPKLGQNITNEIRTIVDEE